MNHNTDKNIVLFGFMGTGKTSAGRRVADLLERRFIDMDVEISRRENKTIPEIFKEDGEPHFRSLERKLVMRLSSQSGLVIATGGGVVLDPENVADLGRNGILVCLSATPEVILKRTDSDNNRPLLQTQDKLKHIIDLLELREKFYAAIPNQIETSRMSPEQTALEIIRLYESLDA